MQIKPYLNNAGIYELLFSTSNASVISITDSLVYTINNTPKREASPKKRLSAE